MAQLPFGILALVPDPLHSYWRPEHYLLQAAAEHCPVVWMEKPHPVQQAFRLGSFHAPNGVSTVPGPANILRYQAPRHLPTIYKLPALNRLSSRARLRQGEQMLRNAGAEKIVLSVWRPEFAAAIEHFPADLRVYIACDDFDQWAGAERFHALEHMALSRSDVVFASSKALVEKHTPRSRSCHHLPNGVDFQSYSQPRPIPSDLARIPSPRIGYVGFVKRQIQLELLADLAAAEPNWSFPIVGPVGNVSGAGDAMARLQKSENVHFLGGRPAHDLPAYWQHFDASVLPYRVDGYTRFISPMKLNEALASGTPAVAAPIEPILPFADVVSLAEGLGEWREALHKALAQTGAHHAHRRQAAARPYDWQQLGDRMIYTLQEAMNSADA